MTRNYDFIVITREQILLLLSKFINKYLKLVFHVAREKSLAPRSVIEISHSRNVLPL